jgi:hypothetical protein
VPFPSRLALLLLAAALAAPAAHALDGPGIANPQPSTPTRLHFHLLDADQDFPINTQAQPDGFAPSSSRGIGSHSLGCLPAGTPLDGATQRQDATWYGYSMPSLVGYDFLENGQPRVSPERGLAYDVWLDPDAAPVLDWYVTTFAAAPPGTLNATAPQADPVLPNVVARATLRTGEAISIDRGGYNSGTVIASGQTAPTTLAGAQTFSGLPGGAHPQVTADSQGAGKGYVYGFHIPLAYAAATIPKEQGFSVRVDLFMSLPACDMAAQDRYVMPNAVRAHADATHHPGLQLAVLAPLRINLLHPQFVGDDLVLHTAEGSPWGAYDVDPLAFRMDVTGPDGPVVNLYRAAVVQRHEHNARLRPLDVTYVWPFRESAAKDGTYTVRFEAANLHGTAHATAVARFEVGKELWVTACGTLAPDGSWDPGCFRQLQDGQGGLLDPNRKSPGLQVALVLGTLGAVAAAVRRRT